MAQDENGMGPSRWFFGRDGVGNSREVALSLFVPILAGSKWSSGRKNR